MYTPRSYRVDDAAALHAFIRQYGFGTLFTHNDGESFATHLPFMIDAGGGPSGTLVAHMARANPHWRAFDRAPPSLAVFMGPHCYISPAWYRDQETVPTWNYAVVHATGTPVLVDGERLREMVMRLVHAHEDPLRNPWDIRKAESVMDAELAGIVGFEIPVDRLEGKFKLNQNRSDADRHGVVRALAESPDPVAREVGRMMAERLRRRGG